MFRKVLIANRGEVAARIARTCKRLGMETVAVYSDADADGVHLQACDEAVRIGPADPRESYLNVQALLTAADATGADVIHPGYGFLSESSEFARAVQGAGITFVGPSPDVMDKTLDRLVTRAIAVQAGVRVLEGSETAIADLAQATQVADELGYPLVFKPVRSGSGVGPIRVDDAEELETAFHKARDRARSASGDERVYLERALDRPRHIGIQIVGDDQQEVVAVGDRECSIQRGAHRLLDETPAPCLLGSEQAARIREAVLDSAVRVAKEAGYTNAGSVEFLIDERGEPYFLEMRPRLQVAHGATEMCSNVDLVEAQMLVAAGKPVPDELAKSIPSGHAIEVRLTTEQPNRGFQPATGEVQDVRWPNASPGRLRIEASIQPGSRVTDDYDSMVAKVITHAPTRHAALLLLDRVLAECAVVPLGSNAGFLRRILAHESFRAGQYDITFVDALMKAR